MENQKKVLFSYSEFPWEELKSIGLTEESFLDLPKDSIDRIFTGNLSPLMKLKFMDRDGNPMQLPESMKLGQNPDGVVPTKFRLTRDAEGKVHVELHPRQSDISRKIGDSELSQKDINRLKKFVTEGGKIVPRRMSGTCAMHQRAVAKAIKRARIAALLPFKGE